MKKIAEFVRNKECIADIGTDHGFLPVFLIEDRRAKRAIVSDASAHSLQKAISLVEEKGLSDKIFPRLGNGLEIISQEDHIELAIIAGMGGHLISEILGAADFLIKKEKIELILQPMQHPEILREFLLNNGFRICNEALVEENDHIYQIIHASVDGEKYFYDQSELEFGKKEHYGAEDQSALYRKLLSKRRNSLRHAMEQIRLSEAANKESLLDAYGELVQKIEIILNGENDEYR